MRTVTRWLEGGRLLARAMGIAIAASPGPAVGSLVLAGVLAGFSVTNVWLAKVVVDRLSTGGDALVPAALYGAVLIATAAAEPVGRLLTAEVEERTCGEIDRRMMAAGMRLVDLDRIERPAFLDEMHLIRQGMWTIPRLIVMCTQAVQVPLTLLGILGLLVGVNPLLPVVLGAVTLAHVVAEQRMGHLKHEAMVRRSRPAREMDYCVRCTAEPAGAKEVRIFGLGRFFLDRYRRRAAAALAEMRLVRLRGARTTAVLAVVHALVVAASFVYVARRASSGASSAGDVALLLNVVVEASVVSWGFAYLFVAGHEAVLKLGTILPFLDYARPAIALAEPGAGRSVPAALHHGVALDDVGFKYPEGQDHVLDGVSGVLPAGKVTALVGANGAGKSTVVKLLTRMYDPDGGEITADGIRLADFDLEAWRSRLASVHQDFARLALTLRENVAVGGLQEDEPAVDAAMRWAGVDSLAERLPQGVDSLLTRRFDGGAELSGGEWQKVALARGAVRDAALVVLDEPTAGLDPEAEYTLFQRFRDLVSGRTALLISHRFSTVRMADHIIVIDDGRVLESGTHEELLALGGRYAELYEMQAGRYR